MRFNPSILAFLLLAFILSEKANALFGLDKPGTDKLGLDRSGLPDGTKGIFTLFPCGDKLRNLLQALTGGLGANADEPKNCPKADSDCPDDQCEDECGDADKTCPDGKICCSQGSCGNKCVDPTTDPPPYGDPGSGTTCKPPMCPPEDTLNCPPRRTCFDDCGGDKKCKDDSTLCCKSKCGNHCAKPVFKGPTGTPTNEKSCL